MYNAIINQTLTFSLIARMCIVSVITTNGAKEDVNYVTNCFFANEAHRNI